MTASIDAEEQVDGPPASCLLESFVKPLVAWVCRTPNFILQGLVDIVFCVRLDYKESGLDNGLTVNFRLCL